MGHVRVVTRVLDHAGPAPRHRPARARLVAKRAVPPRGRRMVTGLAKPRPASAPKAAFVAAVAQAPVVHPRRSSRGRVPRRHCRLPAGGRAHRAWRMCSMITVRTLSPRRGGGSAVSAPGVILRRARFGLRQDTLTLGMLAALRRQGWPLARSRSGPDYIDPAFHTPPAAGRPTTSIHGRCASRPWPVCWRRAGAVAICSWAKA